MYVTTLELENVRSFGKLNFDFKRHDDSYAGWTVFLGGNSSGKSTLLKAIALALLGPDDGRQLIGPGHGWISHGEKKAETTILINRDQVLDTSKGSRGSLAASFEAGVRISVENPETNAYASLKPIENRNLKGSRVPANRGLWNRNASGWFSAGYGPMRRLSGNSSESMRYAADRGPVGRFVTLFREDAALSESEDWLKTNHSRTLESSQPALEKLLASVKELLGDGLLPYGMKIDRITVDHVFVKDSRGMELPMRDISDGCRSVYATILDIVHGLYDVYGYDGLFKNRPDGSIYVDRPGVVLIDEIEAHLHPSWQRDIPYWLKEHFPKMQFLVTTHSPLVAQAADSNGIFVLPSLTDTSREPRRLSDDEHEKIRWGRAEKTLLGTAFGLDSTRSSWANQQIERWKKLTSKKKATGTLPQSEEIELTNLKSQLEIALEPTPELEA
ncbi:AAA family ATPase [Janthinobacterium rivuli]|uniref:AAA family ATPase n=1 Tax=Janthinobacterium rivuli TaxID=2751478 RepID=A0ABY8I804_9BURK|nr:AAA family ATPase [Janthinobacterium rivuli]WFR81064.1 AAA family ATPase [Janthinobacterium rivuli]